MTATGDGRTAYEVCVEGGLGPVLRSALTVDGSASVSVCTVIRLREPDEDRLVEVLDACVSVGLEVQEIHVVP